MVGKGGVRETIGEAHNSAAPSKESAGGAAEGSAVGRLMVSWRSPLSVSPHCWSLTTASDLLGMDVAERATPTALGFKLLLLARI